LIKVLKPLKSEGYVFSRADGSIIRPDYFSKRYRQYRNKHGLPPVRFHDLRHSHATFLFAQGIDGRIIQDRLGHSNIATTLDIYTHTDSKLQAQAVKEIDKIFRKKRT